MQIQVNTDKNIEMTAGLSSEIEALISESFDRFSERLTRVEVHLSDENGSRAGQMDKRCKIEARLAGLQPVVTSHDDQTELQAVRGAADDMKRALTSLVDKLNDKKKGR